MEIETISIEQCILSMSNLRSATKLMAMCGPYYSNDEQYGTDTNAIT